MMRRLLLLPLLIPLLQGCFFTGVESTPRITAGDVRRERETVTDEDTFLVRAADASLADWHPGKEFVVTDSRISLIFGASATGSGDLKGESIRYVRADEAVSPAGGKITDLTFVTPRGHMLTYRVNRPLRQLHEEKSLSVPYTIQKDVVEYVDSRMRGRDLYILTLAWHDDNDNPTGVGKKFVKVHIDSVATGNIHYPLKASFTDASRGIRGCVFFHPGAKGAWPRTFPVVFSFTDPSMRHPSVSPETWEMITQGKVAVGMTREECRLALGSPKEVERGATQSFLREAWLYENGIYLLFEDNILKSFRK